MCSDIVVSICCVTYNHGKYLRDALDGFLNQNVKFRYEIIVHDDASTDNTPNIIKEYAEKYPDIIKPILQMENQYSKGVKIFDTYIAPKVIGKYIARCEGDDFWCSSNKLQKQVDFLETHNEYSACAHNTERIDCLNGRRSLYSVFTQDKTLRVEDVIQYKAKSFHLSSVLYRKEFILRPEAFHTKYFGDYSLILYLAMVGKIYYFRDVMSVYRFASSESSWTYGYIIADSHKEREITNIFDENRMLREVDKYSQRKYHEVIYIVQRKNEFTVLNINGNHKQAYKEYKDVIQRLSPKERFKFIVKRYMPVPVQLYQHIKRLVYKLSIR